MLNVVVAVIVESTLAMSKKRNDDIIETLEHDRRDSIFQAPADSSERVTVTVEFAPSPTAKVQQGLQFGVPIHLNRELLFQYPVSILVISNQIR